ncbi:serine/threonine protein kinase [Anabaena sp. UHCC 0187]|uniref:serine/threonine protein kinase n=1 Tax=Anabaena sp. UHCC 0187 TaxID=2590018 RepID=UPI0014479957|nr:serine/threonine-protein kinase [Anabaena sp. UHCC 0187]MTJ11159.1 serine/threonine protein kinase [Anabaena sp. UHCC 0187]
MNNILRIGTLLRERYTITDLLSKNSGFGITYKVRDNNHPDQPILILKQLKKPTAPTLNIQNLPNLEQEEILNQYWQEYLRLFRIETQALAKLGEKYAQIPRIYERFEEGGEEFYVQEYIQGHSLSAEVKQGQKLSEQKTIDLLIEILEVFEYIQTNPGYSVIHRDIKPDNIIRRSEDNQLVVIDFGLAKEVTVPGIKVGSILGGTEGYIAPEITSKIVSFASDIYSIGMIGVFAITGENPSHNLTLAQTWQTKANVSSELAAVLNKMICYDYQKRFQNAKEALQALTENQQTPPPPVPPAPQIPWKLILGTISGIIIIIGVVVAVISILSKSNDQLITDGKAKSGQLTSSDQKELSSDKNYDVYTFKTDKKQYLTVQIISNDFQPQLSIFKPDDKYFNPVPNVGTKDNDFTASIMIEPGIYQFKITSSKAASGNYVIKAWVTDR